MVAGIEFPWQELYMMLYHPPELGANSVNTLWTGRPLSALITIFTVLEDKEHRAGGAICQYEVQKQSGRVI
jgi:hypothetical protein